MRVRCGAFTHGVLSEETSRTRAGGADGGPPPRAVSSTAGVSATGPALLHAGSAGDIRSFGHGSLRPTVPIAVPWSTVASVIGSRMDSLIMARR